MITKLTEHEFVDAFEQMGRGNQFSRAARRALFEYYEQLEDDMGEPIEFDCIAICCEWAEYGDAAEWAKDHYTFHQFRAIEETAIEESLNLESLILEDHLRDNTQVIEFNGGILVQAF